MYYAACCCGPYQADCDCEGYEYAKVSCRTSFQTTPINLGAISSSTECDILCRNDIAETTTAIETEYAEATTFMRCADNTNERTEFRSSAIPEHLKTFDPDSIKFFRTLDRHNLRTFNHLDRGCHPSPGACSDENCEQLLHNCCNYESGGNIIQAAGRWLYYTRTLEQVAITNGMELVEAGGFPCSGCRPNAERARADSRTFVGRAGEMPVTDSVIEQLDPEKYYRWIRVRLPFCSEQSRRVEEVDSLSGPHEPYYNSSLEVCEHSDTISCWQINDIGDACDGAAVGTPVITSDWNREFYQTGSNEEFCPEEEFGPNCCGEGTIPASSSSSSFTMVTTATDVVFDLEFTNDPPDPW